MKIYYETVFYEKVIVENEDVYDKCEFIDCDIIYHSNLKEFCKDCKFFCSTRHQLTKEQVDIYRSIETKNDALLHCKNSERLIQNKCLGILNGTSKTKTEKV